MSESEKERIERENRKRRIRKTKRTVKAQQQNSAEPTPMAVTVQEETETVCSKGNHQRIMVFRELRERRRS